MKRNVLALAAIDSEGNIAPNSVGMFDLLQHEDKFDLQMTVVKVLGKIPNSPTMYDDYLVLENVEDAENHFYEFVLKDPSDRWHLEISGPDTIVADGSSDEQYVIKKVDASGNDYKKGTETVDVSVSRGTLSSLTIKLKYGKGSVGIKSVAETVGSNISIKFDGKFMTSKNIKFVPA